MKPYRTPSVFAAGVAALVLCASQPANAFLDKILGTGGTKTESANQPRQRSTVGVKQPIAVSEFENKSGWSGQWKLGYNMSIMLESALFDTGRFIVLSRDKLNSVLREQDLAASGRAAKTKGTAETGKLRSARFIATGAIVEVSEDTQGSSGGVSYQGVRVGGGGKKATITAIVTLIDTTTGEIVAKERVSGKAGGRKLRIGYFNNGLNTEIGGFAKEPLGEATQDVINEAVDFIVKNMKEVKLDASVALVKDGEVIINRGSVFGIAVGHRFEVRTEGEEIVDPSTGEVLDRTEGQTLCRLEVKRVKEKVAYCEVVEGEAPERGDVVIME